MKKPILLNILTALVLAFPELSFAQRDCSSFLVNQFSINVIANYYYKGGSAMISPAELLAVNKIVRESETLYQDLVDGPLEVRFGISGEALAFARIGLIYVPGENAPDGIRRVNSAIVVHELTHVIFDRAISIWYDNRIGLPGHSRRLESLITRLNLLRAQEPKLKEFYELEAEIISINNDFLARQSGLGLSPSNNPNSQTEARFAIEELFSDFLAVMYKNDPNALNFPSEVGRSFEAGLSPSNWAVRESHGLYGPTRSFLGPIIFQNELTLSQKSKLVKKIFDLLAEELILILKENPMSHLKGKWGLPLNPIDPGKLNSRLINRIKLSFAN